MKTATQTAIVLLAIFSLFLGIIQAKAEATTQEQAMIKSKGMILEGSRKMAAAEQIMNQVKQMARDGKNPPETRQMIVEAEKMMSEGEKIWEQGQEIGERHRKTGETMGPLTEQGNELVNSSKAMREGMTTAQAMLAEKPKVLEQAPKMADVRTNRGN